MWNLRNNCDIFPGDPQSSQSLCDRKQMPIGHNFDKERFVSIEQNKSLMFAGPDKVRT